MSKEIDDHIEKTSNTLKRPDVNKNLKVKIVNNEMIFPQNDDSESSSDNELIYDMGDYDDSK